MLNVVMRLSAVLATLTLAGCFTAEKSLLLEQDLSFPLEPGRYVYYQLMPAETCKPVNDLAMLKAEREKDIYCPLILTTLARAAMDYRLDFDNEPGKRLEFRVAGSIVIGDIVEVTLDPEKTAVVYLSGGYAWQDGDRLMPRRGSETDPIGYGVSMMSCKDSSYFHFLVPNASGICTVQSREELLLEFDEMDYALFEEDLGFDTEYFGDYRFVLMPLPE